MKFSAKKLSTRFRATTAPSTTSVRGGIAVSTGRKPRGRVGPVNDSLATFDARTALFSCGRAARSLGLVLALLGALLVLSVKPSDTPVSAAPVSAPISAAPAVSHNGRVDIKGPGSVYNRGPDTIAVEAVNPGSTAIFEVKVVNTGVDVGQFNVRLVSFFGANLLAGSVTLTKLATGPDGYWTPPIAPGKYQALTLKWVVPAGAARGSSTYAQVYLSAANGAFQGTTIVIAEVAAPSSGGTTAADILIRQGNQLFVGGTHNPQRSSSPALLVGQKATFNLRLENNGSSPSAIAAYVQQPPDPCVTMTIKAGTTNVTSAMMSGTYVTPVLTVGGVQALTVEYQLMHPSCSTYYTYAVTEFRARRAGTSDFGRSVIAYVPLG